MLTRLIGLLSDDGFLAVKPRKLAEYRMEIVNERGTDVQVVGWALAHHSPNSQPQRGSDR